ncbi:UDP-3-O-(3-hydroxymyristoyl)glucosamine N-acyltransferase [Marnyiella aurantia]|uniref:UDP-3-O-(3-hydroxymyristoyl)glucosamine N-acyltransferase n=1 Tax=Marnyiella aurantia TaxID=2758037 RepID=A0A7D7LNK3_9FLAO|nr:UDP-3-O-(3-hydroxymyristoyl)glucosamine N-acyltransferase [Marnyiella aurantia]MBA5247446.1 UDP-3-O-(3-hydroxymyristoyl)glucosamine N-acyltransferase [Marnyiella aurantia]QMS99202.1 UDP-3-O-(3-hydroxymyristoyl)glucosamine N-acyltransferase [Marnyiella aurantia]
MTVKKISLEQILNALQAVSPTVHGPVEDVFADHIADPKKTTATTLDWVNSIKTNKQEIAEGTPAKVILADAEVVYSDAMKAAGKTLIIVPNPKMAFSLVANEFFVEKEEPGIHPTAVIHPEAEIGPDVYIGPYVHIGKAKIGKGTVISAYVRIYDKVTIGENCFFKEGAVIGGAGFGYEKDSQGNRFRFPQIGGVIIGNYVEVGGNTCIDRGALSDTVIGDHTKIDNLCHISHNVDLGRNVMVIACSEISGSCVLGDDVWVGPNTSIRDHRKVGAGALLGMGSVVVKDVPADEVWTGNPAKLLNR